MDYICGPLILVSQDKVRMMDFLCDVFEFDVDTENDTITKGPLSLKIISAPKDEVALPQGITFAFLVKGKDQIQEILNKYNFFLYRKSQDPHQKNLKFEEKGLDQGLLIKDFDGRNWKFDLMPGERINEL